MTRLFRSLDTTSPWALRFIVFLAGLLGSLSHAPVGFAAAILVPILAGLFILQISAGTRAQGLLGFALGLGYFAPTLSWIIEPFFVDAAVTGWMAPFALLGLAALMAVFWALPFALISALRGGIWGLVVLWPAAELLRAHFMTGFPWAIAPMALVDVMGGQALAWLGPYGLFMAMLALGALLFRRSFVLKAVGAVVLGFGVFWPVIGDETQFSDHKVRLVQPNAPQDEKWDPNLIPVFYERKLELTAASDPVDLIVWPEISVPYLLENSGPVFEEIASFARGAPVVVGIQRRQERRYFNSLVVVNARGKSEEIYDKHHLVPFGEYMPAQWFFRHINISGLAARAQGGYSPGSGPETVDIAGVGTALPLICYEAVFAHNLFGTERPDFLLQITNDAWFGLRLGPQQHLAHARMRAIEQGLPMLRAANTGISAIIDAKGRVVTFIPLNQSGFIDSAVPKPAAPTLYSQIRDWPILICVFVLFLSVLRNRLTTKTNSVP